MPTGCRRRVAQRPAGCRNPAVLMVRLDVGLSLRSSGSTEVALVEGADMRALVAAVAGFFGLLPKDGTGSTATGFLFAYAGIFA
ncbi:MAG: hypothetical protein WA639_06815 [Candidatus Acidiferrum sp.]